MDQKLSKAGFIDSHCHLPLIKEPLDPLLKSCELNHVTRILNVGYDLSSSRDSIDLSKKNGMIDAAVGIHPHYVEGDITRVLDEIDQLAQDPHVVALGEIGLDSLKSTASQKDQLRWMELQLEVAQNRKLPVIIHNRSSDKGIGDIIHQHKAVKGILHCFSSDQEFAIQMLDMGWFLSFSGNITYPKNESLRNIMKECPLDQLLLETDAPYLTPMPYRGKKENSPLYMEIIYTLCSEIRCIDREELKLKLAENYSSLFLSRKGG